MEMKFNLGDSNVEVAAFRAGVTALQNRLGMCSKGVCRCGQCEDAS